MERREEVVGRNGKMGERLSQLCDHYNSAWP